MNIAKSYWRLIKAGLKKYTEIPVSQRKNVIKLAETDLMNNTITQAEYESYFQDFNF